MRTSCSNWNVLRVLAAIVWGLAAPPATGWAQSGNEAHWGLRVTAIPGWAVPDRVMEIDVLQDFIGEGSNVRGSEFAVGIVRGSRFGGDWGLGYVRKTVSDKTRVEIDDGETCASVGAAVQCGPNRQTYTTKGAALHGVELHKFVRWFTIKRRAQVGMNLGLAALTATGGTVTKGETLTTPTFDPVTRQVRLVTEQTTSVFDGKGFLEDLGVPSILPSAKIELGVTAIVARNLKVRASGGVNLPGVQAFSVTGVYLFGQ